MADSENTPDGPINTLFDKNYEEIFDTKTDEFPYTLSIEGLSRDDTDKFPEMESTVFSDVMRHEVMIHEPRGCLAGPMELEIADDKSGQPKLVDLLDQVLSVPPWVEQDAVSIVRCDARGILLVDRLAQFERLHQQNVCDHFQLILATGLGIPRLAMRRFLRRLQVECSLPVFVLVDNDTWGYFFFSVLTRGVLPPHASCQHLRVDDGRYLGLRAQDGKLLKRMGGQMRPWKSNWDLRLEKMRKYDCFQASPWRSEFEYFQKEQCAVDLTDRGYQSKRYAVDPSDGSVGNALTDDTWYDESGNVIKHQPAGAKFFTKTVYDGAGSQTNQYQGYDVDETSYTDASTVTGDTILQQT